MLIRETDVRRFGPLIQKVLAQAKFTRQGTAMVGEAETGKVIAASRRGWTPRLRVRLSGNTATAEAGAIKPFCFPAGTLVTMGDGSLRPIEAVQVGDEVQSRDQSSERTSVQKVTQLFRHLAHQTLRLRLSDGESIESTPEHPFFVPGQGFRAAKYLVAGTMLATLSNTPLKVEAVQVLDGHRTVYNFGVDLTHTYFVGRSGLWVHNDCILRVNLRVVSSWRMALPRVVKNNLSEADYLFAKKISAYRGGRLLQGEIDNYSPKGTLPGYDGWWDRVGGPKISLKRVSVSTVRRIKDEAKRAEEKAVEAHLSGHNIETYIDAPLVDATALLDYIRPGQPLDTISTRNGTIKSITIFCKDNVVVHLDPP